MIFLGNSTPTGTSKHELKMHDTMLAAQVLLTCRLFYARMPTVDSATNNYNCPRCCCCCWVVSFRVSSNVCQSIAFPVRPFPQPCAQTWGCRFYCYQSPGSDVIKPQPLQHVMGNVCLHYKVSQFSLYFLLLLLFSPGLKQIHLNFVHKTDDCFGFFCSLLCVCLQLTLTTGY